VHLDEGRAMDDTTPAAEAQAAREERFVALFQATKKAVRAYAWRRAPETADDIVAETFTLAWQHLDEVPSEPLPWLFSVARNVLLNGRRGERRRQERELRCAPAAVAPSFTDAVDAGSDVCAALQRLPEPDREILLLAAWEGLGHKELATVVGCSPAAAGVRLYRARRRLKAALDGTETDAPLATDTERRLPDEC
ncbi:MAG TPA: sigma-70 family RNA polymerase sigma factor, partial [Thermoleophilia bacterium]|nr:sigma-70 family RNA polymerase sigma factor [Thermoleophilia bacterium]